MSEQEWGTCSTCRQEGVMVRKYYYFDVNCNCCNGDKHFEIVYHHEDCVPRPHKRISVSMDPDE